MTTQVVLRAVEPADIEVFYEHQADPAAAAMAAFPARDRAAHFDHWNKRVLGNPVGIVRTVVVDGAVAGNIVSWIDPELGRLLGYWIGREFWGRGIATEAVRLYLSEVRDRPLHAFVAANNVGSRRVLENSGFAPTSDEPHVGTDGVAEILYRLG